MIQHPIEQIKMKTCVMVSQTLPLSIGIPSSNFKSLVNREINLSKIPKFQTINRFIEKFQTINSFIEKSK